MKLKNIQSLLALSTLASLMPLNTAEAKSPVIHTFEAGKGAFLLDQKPFTIKAAELHYARIPRPYWEHRIKMCKSMGMNAVCIYIFWNAHEPQEGQYDFTGNNDVAEFVRLCQKQGMWVIVRPGPYVCAEWEMGGLPWWLLKKDDMKLRSLDPDFMRAMGRFERRVAEELTPLAIHNGGPIIMMQVENEFGSYGEDKPYVSAVRDSLRAAGWDKTVLFQCDWSSNFEKNGLPDLLWTMNFGTGANVLDQFKRLGELRPESPKMCSEYWSGWFDGWGRAHETRDASAMVSGLKTMLDNGISFSLYMAHGGTSFGHWAGSNSPGYQPDCTSYDYDAPINEQGAATPKFFELRQMLQGYSATTLPPVPKAIPVVALPKTEFREHAPLFAAHNLPESIEADGTYTMEMYDQGWGSILYSCELPALSAPTILRIADVHDFAMVYVDGQLMGKLYRGNGDEALQLPALPKGGRLEIFVEAMGRINYSRLIHDRKGITEGVTLHTRMKGYDQTLSITDWRVQLFPVSYEFAASRKYDTYQYASEILEESPAKTRVPAPRQQHELAGYFRTHVKVSKVGDTYLDLSSWSKGIVWVNGHCLGRYWNVGPQQALYLPGCWLKKGDNEVIILDIVGPKNAVTEGLTAPVIDQLHKENMPKDAVKMPKTEKKQPRAARQTQVIGNDAAPGAK